MRIGNELPLSYIQNPAAARYSDPVLPLGREQPNNQSGPGVTVDISPEGRAAYDRARVSGDKGIDAVSPTECQTCKNRRYKDVSDDPSVSFQTHTYISPGQSAAAVSSHESEHVSNEQAKAEQEGREIISQTVTLKTSICPECKRVYVSGGETRTTSRKKIDMEV